MVDPANWLEDYDKTLATAAANAQAASASLRQAGGHATSPRGEVSVVVGAGGALEDLMLTPAARALEAGQLAQLILATARQAQQAAGAQVVEIMTEYVGEGPALEIVKQNLPSVAAGDEPPADDSYFANPPEITK
nr:YbaB/EbfC family nucleoid-associated protein [Amycolatopsis nigrescens]